LSPDCPQRFQDRITRAGGKNRYGQPLYKLAWSQSETVRAGGVWPWDRYAGYRRVYVANGSPYPPRQGYWMVMEWKAPEDFGGEAQYFFLHRDETTGLCSLGPYPHYGRYEIATKLVWSMIDNGRLILEPWPLNSAVVDMILPTIIRAKKDSVKRRREFAAAEKIRTERKMEAAIEAMMKDAQRPLLLPEKIDDRIRLMEKQWATFLSNPTLRRGFQQA
jgi:hypothetical protein